MRDKAEDIYERYAQTVYRFLFSLTGEADISEELTQETFYQARIEILKAYQANPSDRSGSDRYRDVVVYVVAIRYGVSLSRYGGWASVSGRGLYSVT